MIFKALLRLCWWFLSSIRSCIFSSMILKSFRTGIGRNLSLPNNMVRVATTIALWYSVCKLIYSDAIPSYTMFSTVPTVFIFFSGTKFQIAPTQVLFIHSWMEFYWPFFIIVEIFLVLSALGDILNESP